MFYVQSFWYIMNAWLINPLFNSCFLNSALLFDSFCRISFNGSTTQSNTFRNPPSPYISASRFNWICLFRRYRLSTRFAIIDFRCSLHPSTFRISDQTSIVCCVTQNPKWSWMLLWKIATIFGTTIHISKWSHCMWTWALWWRNGDKTYSHTSSLTTLLVMGLCGRADSGFIVVVGRRTATTTTTTILQWRYCLASASTKTTT